MQLLHFNLFIYMANSQTWVNDPLLLMYTLNFTEMFVSENITRKTEATIPGYEEEKCPTTYFLLA